MSEVDQVLAEAAAASKKVRVKKEDVGAAKEPKAKKVKEPKQYPVWNEDGTQATNDDGSLKFSTERTKKPRVKKEGTGTRSSVNKEAVITLLVTENPKRAGSKSHERFALYVDGMTVAAALAAGLTTGDIHHDVAHNFISLS